MEARRLAWQVIHRTQVPIKLRAVVLLDNEHAGDAVERFGKPLRLRFKITHPTTGLLVKDLSIVHDMPFHLFVVSVEASAAATGMITPDALMARRSVDAVVVRLHETGLGRALGGHVRERARHGLRIVAERLSAHREDHLEVAGRQVQLLFAKIDVAEVLARRRDPGVVLPEDRRLDLRAPDRCSGRLRDRSHRPDVVEVRMGEQDPLDVHAQLAGELPRIVADLVAAGEQIYGVSVVRSTLEEVYLEAIAGSER